MARLVRWFALIVGLVFILAFTVFFIGVFIFMGPFGGIPWSWNLLLLNFRWVVLLLAGILLIGFATYMFRRSSRQHLPNEETGSEIV